MKMNGKYDDMIMDESEMILGVGQEHSFAYCNYTFDIEDKVEERDESENLYLTEILSKISKKNEPKKEEENKKEEPKYSQSDNETTIQKLIDNFDCFTTRADDYNTWFPDICAIYNSVEDKEQAYKLIHLYSQKGKTYDEDGVNKELQKIVDRYLRVDKRRTIGSMMNLAKEENKEKYNTLFGKKTKAKKIVSLESSIKSSTEYSIAKVFHKEFGENFKMVDIPSKKCFYWDKITGRWKLDNGCSTMRNMISNELKALYDKELTSKFEKLQSTIDEGERENLDREIKELGSLINKLEKTTDKNNIVREIADLVVDTEFEKQLNCNTDLFAFNNCVLDLTTMTTRPAKYDDYISWSCGYDYNADINQERLQELKDLLKKIFPDPNVLQLVLEVLSCGFSGKPLEYFVVFNGSGGNGKGLIDEFIKIIFGDYGYIYAPVCLLTEKDKTGPNPEKAKLHNKRIVIMKEPSSKEKLNNDRIKDMTGGGNLSGRDLYAGKEDCEILMALILIMECNVRPLFQEDPTDGDIRRIVDILFPNKFTNKKELIDNETVFQAEVKYKSLEWKLEHRNEFVFLLLEAFKKLKKNDYVLNIPKCVEERSKKYINESFTILKMFNDFYEYTEDEEDFVKISDMFSLISTCSAYTNLTKQEKRLYNKSYFVEFFSTHTDFKGGIYNDRKKLKGTDYRNILWKYKLKEID